MPMSTGWSGAEWKNLPGSKASGTSDFNGACVVRQALFVAPINKPEKLKKYVFLSSELEYLKGKTAEPCRQVAAIGPHLFAAFSAPALRSRRPLRGADSPLRCLATTRR
ncbi:hypothetical protein PSEUDO8BK_10636 [Pseudomonas sp. 8BK]|nr:hypothetical protein PSEUDO8BK_10636 [Pseudomonas sp. 8BK]